MFILTEEEVKYCVGIKQSSGTDSTVSGLVYNNKFFVQAKHYDASEQEEAIKDCRENFLDNKEMQVPTLVVKDRKGIGIWIEDNGYQAQLGTASNSVRVTKPDNSNLEQLIKRMRSENGLSIKTRRYKLKLYHHCFVGSEAVDWLTKSLNISREKAIKIGQQLVKSKIIHHVKDEHDFKDEELFYRFYQDEDKKIWTDKLI